MLKRTLAMLLIALSLVNIVGNNIYAISTEESYPETKIISPRYTHVNLIAAGLIISDAGYATSYGSVQLSQNGYSSTLTCELQRYNNGSWTTLKTWTATGSTMFGADVEGHYYITSGYNYRSHVTAVIKDSSGKTVETVICDKEKKF